jgi:hypothetical protein
VLTNAKAQVGPVTDTPQYGAGTFQTWVLSTGGTGEVIRDCEEVGVSADGQDVVGIEVIVSAGGKYSNAGNTVAAAVCGLLDTVLSGLG